MRKIKKIMCAVLVAGILVTSNVTPASAAEIERSISRSKEGSTSQTFQVNKKTDIVFGIARIASGCICTASAANDAVNCAYVSFGKSAGNWTNLMKKTDMTGKLYQKSDSKGSWAKIKFYWTK